MLLRDGPNPPLCSGPEENQREPKHQPSYVHLILFDLSAGSAGSPLGESGLSCGLPLLLAWPMALLGRYQEQVRCLKTSFKDPGSFLSKLA